MEDPSTQKVLPNFVRTYREPSEFWHFIKKEFATYAERRSYIQNEFQTLLELLENAHEPPVTLISDALEAFDAGAVATAWKKALARADNDPDGALTAARALLESICLHILGINEPDDENISNKKRDDLPKLYRRTSEALNLAPSQHTEHIFKQILGGATQVIEGLGALRNRLGDAHGKGRRPVRVSPRHAHFAVNLAGAVALFLIETDKARKQSSR